VLGAPVLQRDQQTRNCSMAQSSQRDTT